MATSDALEKELHQLRAQYQKEREESQAWIGELEREVEKVKGEHAALARRTEGELETLRGQLEAARGELESARADVTETAQTLAEVEAAKTALDERMAELAARVAQERDEAQVRTTKLQEERDRLDARLRRSSADTGKVSDLQKEIDTLLAELADKEESVVALRTGHESVERELEEARAALGKEKEEAAGRLATLVAQQSDLERQVQEAHEHRQTLERQMASLRAEVVELEVAREEDAERLRELGTREASARVSAPTTACARSATGSSASSTPCASTPRTRAARWPTPTPDCASCSRRRARPGRRRGRRRAISRFSSCVPSSVRSAIDASVCLASSSTQRRAPPARGRVSHSRTTRTRAPTAPELRHRPGSASPFSASTISTCGRSGRSS